MNRAETKKFVEENGIVTLKADKTGPAPEVDQLLLSLGNKTKQIPFYAIFPAGNPNQPILLDGLLGSPKTVIQALEKAGPSQMSSPSGPATNSSVTALRETPTPQ